ncbi:hypothetical protein B5S30_g4735 [[Candida] boidinii]|nr:hypothetical protein B5S30_g4735 [[Candida] boidinii]
MSSSASITEPFIVTSLPRLPDKPTSSKICCVSNIDSPTEFEFDIGVSGSFISTYITKPSPRMTWSYALSPQSTVNAFDSININSNFDSINKENSTNSDNNIHNSINSTNDKLIAISITERKKNFIRLIKQENSFTNQFANGSKFEVSSSTSKEDGEHDDYIHNDNKSSSASLSTSLPSSSINNTSTNNSQTLITKKINISEQCIGLKFSNDFKFLYCLFANGKISIFNINDLIVLENNELELNESIKHDLNMENKDLLNSSLRKFKSVLFYSFINSNNSNFNDNSNNDSFILLLVLFDEKEKLFNVKLITFDNSNLIEISNSIIQDKNLINNFKDLKFTYDQSGKLLILDNSLNLFIFSLPFTNFLKKIELNSIFSDEPSDSPIDILPVSTNRCLVSKGSLLVLIDTKFDAILSKFNFYSKSNININKELNNNNNSGNNNKENNFKQKYITLLKSPIVKGNSAKTKKTFALVLLKNPNDNYATIQQISIDVGLGKLSDVLGKGIVNSNNNSNNNKNGDDSIIRYNGTPSLITLSNVEFDNYSNSVKKINDTELNLNKELNEFITRLRKYKQEGKFDILDKELVNFLKNEEEEEVEGEGEQDIKQNGSNKKNSNSIISENEKFKVFEVDKDRVVDNNFIKDLIDILFEVKLISKNNSKRVLKLNSTQIAENSLTYLLTHPLFPCEYCSGLLNTLKDYPRLMRQAIVTCPRIPCIDLIEQLSLVENEDIFKDLIARLTEEFSKDEITENTIKLIKKSSFENKFDEINLDQIIHKIIKMNYGYEVLNSFIDSNGLVLSLQYSKNEKQLETLINKTNKKINSLNFDTQLLTFVNQSLLLSEQQLIDQKKNKKKLKNKNKKKLNSKSSSNNNSASLNGNANSTTSDIINISTNKLDLLLDISDKPTHFDAATNSISGNDSSNSSKIPQYSIERLVI